MDYTVLRLLLATWLDNMDWSKYILCGKAGGDLRLSLEMVKRCIASSGNSSAVQRD